MWSLITHLWNQPLSVWVDSLYSPHSFLHQSLFVALTHNRGLKVSAWFSAAFGQSSSSFLQRYNWLLYLIRWVSDDYPVLPTTKCFHTSCQIQIMGPPSPAPSKKKCCSIFQSLSKCISRHCPTCIPVTALLAPCCLFWPHGQWIGSDVLPFDLVCSLDAYLWVCSLDTVINVIASFIQSHR